MVSNRKIGILMTASSGWIAGVIYIQNLINSIRFLPVNKRPDLTLFVWENSPSEFYDEIDNDLFELITIKQNGTLLRLKKIICNVLAGTYYEKNLLKVFSENKMDVVYPFHSSIRTEQLKYVDWIPDFQHKYLPGMFSEDEIKTRDMNFLKIAENADIVILSSKDAKKDFDCFYPQQKSKSRVLSFASYICDDIFNNNHLSVKQKYNLPEKFLMVSNQFWQHKDHLTLFHAINGLKKKGINIPLICTGELKDYRNVEYYQQIKEYISHNDLSSNIQILGFIPRSEQLQIMRLSAAIIQPSLFEGWSTVIEDGRALGKIMFISNIPVHIEQNPDNGVYFKASSKKDLMDKLEDKWENLSPGPDFESENYARSKSKELMKNFAYNFLKIMN